MIKFFEIAHFKLFLKLRLEPLQFGYIACHYDQIIHIEDLGLSPTIFTRLYDIQQMIRFAPTKDLFDEERVNTVVPRPWRLFEFVPSFFEFAHKVFLPILYKTF